MEQKRSRLQPQSPYWYEDLPASEAPLKVGDENDEPALSLDLNYVDDNVFELSRATSIQRGFGLIFGVSALIGIVFCFPFIFGMYKNGRPEESPLMSSLLVFALIGLLIALLHIVKRAVRTPQDLPVIFNRGNRKIFAMEYIVKKNPFAKWAVVVKEFDWSRVEAEIGKIAGYNGKTYSVRYGLILAQCEVGTTKVDDRIILKSQVATPLVLHQMWAYIRCFMNEGAEGLRAIKPFPHNASFRRCMLEFYPLFDRTEEGERIRASMHVIEITLLTVAGIPLFWLFLPAGLFEYIGQRLAPKPKWPAEVISRTGQPVTDANRV